MDGLILYIIIIIIIIIIAIISFINIIMITINNFILTVIISLSFVVNQQYQQGDRSIHR